MPRAFEAVAPGCDCAGCILTCDGWVRGVSWWGSGGPSRTLFHQCPAEGDGTMLEKAVIVYLSDPSDLHRYAAVEWPTLVLGSFGGALKINGRYFA